MIRGNTWNELRLAFASAANTTRPRLSMKAGPVMAMVRVRLPISPIVCLIAEIAGNLPTFDVSKN